MWRSEEVQTQLGRGHIGAQDWRLRVAPMRNAVVHCGRSCALAWRGAEARGKSEQASEGDYSAWRLCEHEHGVAPTCGGHAVLVF
jgi:hypothetical protein